MPFETTTSHHRPGDPDRARVEADPERECDRCGRPVSPETSGDPDGQAVPLCWECAGTE